MAVDNAGNMYVTGSTASSNFPFNPQATPPVASAKRYPFVLKVDSTARVVYSFVLERTAQAFSKTGVVSTQILPSASGSSILIHSSSSRSRSRITS